MAFKRKSKNNFNEFFSDEPPSPFFFPWGLREGKGAHHHF
jgi:hypothetical protein